MSPVSSGRAVRSQIEACIERRAFEIVYQPIVDLDTAAVVGVEALCRFTDGTPTERRFQQAETLGLAPGLDLAIIETTLADVDRIPNGYVSINLSPSTLLDSRLADTLLADGVPAERVVVEVTEHARIPDYEKAEQLLGVIRASGIRLAVDDAGAGYATFRHILSLSPDIIKMDRSITQDIDVDAPRRALATALVIFAGEIGATVIAEGAETDGEIRALRRAGIHRAQGYALARPAPLPLGPLTYQPLAIADVLDLPASTSEDLPAPTASAAVTRHNLLAAIGTVEGVLEILHEHLTATGESRYRDLAGIAQRQVRHVGSTVRDMGPGDAAEVAQLMAQADADAAPYVVTTPAPAPTEPPVHMDTEESLRSHAEHRLQAMADAVRDAQGQLKDTVSLARKAGVTWDEIASILGMTRQGVTKRYGTGRRH
jgi:EAL domain-containing protein (putative c-di-GMP-specific phosphodiesterase class I)